MAARPAPEDAMIEYCPACDRETSHDVSIRIVRESHATENAEFSREPYRVAECLVCGYERRRRMNDA